MRFRSKRLSIFLLLACLFVHAIALKSDTGKDKSADKKPDNSESGNIQTTQTSNSVASLSTTKPNTAQPEPENGKTSKPLSSAPVTIPTTHSGPANSENTLIRSSSTPNSEATTTKAKRSAAGDVAPLNLANAGPNVATNTPAKNSENAIIPSSSTPNSGTRTTKPKNADSTTVQTTTTSTSTTTTSGKGLRTTTSAKNRAPKIPASSLSNSGATTTKPKTHARGSISTSHAPNSGADVATTQPAKHAETPEIPSSSTSNSGATTSKAKSSDLGPVPTTQTSNSGADVVTTSSGINASTTKPKKTEPELGKLQSSKLPNSEVDVSTTKPKNAKLSSTKAFQPPNSGNEVLPKPNATEPKKNGEAKFHMSGPSGSGASPGAVVGPKNLEETKGKASIPQMKSSGSGTCVAMALLSAIFSFAFQ